MALILADRVRETSTTTGTGALSLAGAVVGYQTFSSAIGNTNTCYYAISNPGVAEWEVGIGTYATSGNTLTRTTILKSSNANAAVNFSAGTKDVFVTYPATKSVYLDASGNVTIAGGLGVGGSAAPGSTGLAVTGTLSATGVITGTASGGATGSINVTPTTGTNSAYANFVNTGGAVSVGQDSSTGGAITGVAYAAALWHTGNYPVIIGSNNVKVGSFSSTGLSLGSLGLTAGTGTFSNAAGGTVATVEATGIGATDFGELRVIGGTTNARISSYSQGHNTRANQVWLNTVGATSPVVIGVNSVGIGTFSSTGLAVTGTLTSTLDATIYGLTVGRGAGAVSTNTAVGASALAATATVGFMTAVGYQAATASTSGPNEAFGYRSLYGNTTGSSNTAIGSFSLLSNTTGGFNIAVGRDALQANTTASNDTAVGYQAGYTNVTGTGNTYIGYIAGKGRTGNYNTAVGMNSLTATGAGAQNTAIGYDSMQGTTSGASNTGVGFQPLYQNITGNYNTAVGDTALFNTTASNNTAVGYQSGYYVTTGARNVSLGGLSLTAGTAAASSGSDNTAVGYAALYRNTTGSYNVGVGGSDGSASALSGNTTGSNNTALGVGSLGSNTTGSNNTAVGYQAGYSATTGNDSVLIGYKAGFGITTSANNICIGSGSGTYTTSIVTGAQNIHIGAYTTASSSSASYEIVVGYVTAGKGANTGFINPNSGGVYQGNNGATWSVTSDQRLKKNIVYNNVGLEKITAIQVRNFEYRLPEEVDTELKPTDAIKKEGVQLGVIAQELQLVLPDCVKTESTGVMSVNADNLTWYLVNAIKELDAKFEAYKSTHP